MTDTDPGDESTAADETPTPELGPNLFPDNARRRIPGLLYCVIGAVVAIGCGLLADDAPVLIDRTMAVAGLLLVALGIYSFVAGGRLAVDEEAALQAAAVAVQKPIGHASAQMGWRGWRSRPTWRILWYSAEDPPRNRGLVLVDGYDGTVLDAVVETNPEADLPIDWSLDDEA